MPPTLDDAWARAEWTHDALEALTLALEDFRDDHPFAVTDEVDLPSLTRVIRASRPNLPPPLVGLLFGDVLAGLRASLDQAACAAVEATGGMVGAAHGFPIATDEAAFEAAWRVELAGAAAEVVEYMRSVQPFGPAGAAEPLARLAALATVARQRAVPLVTVLSPVPHERVRSRVSAAGDEVELRIGLDPSNLRSVVPWKVDALVLLGAGPAAGESLLEVARDLYADVTQYVLPGFIEAGLLPLTRPRQLPVA